MDLAFGWSELISVGALLIAAAGWIDSTRRIRTSEVQFALEEAEPAIDLYKLRNLGTRTAKNVQIDPASVMRWQVSGGWAPVLRPQESTDLYLSKTDDAEWPDELLIRFGRRQRSERVIVFPRPE